MTEHEELTQVWLDLVEMYNYATERENSCDTKEKKDSFTLQAHVLWYVIKKLDHIVNYKNWYVDVNTKKIRVIKHGN